jgi:hypothetical protein
VDVVVQVSLLADGLWHTRIVMVTLVTPLVDTTCDSVRVKEVLDVPAVDLVDTF